MRTTISACGTRKTCGRCKIEKPLEDFKRLEMAIAYLRSHGGQ